MKSVDEVDSSDYELGSTDSAYLAKQFKRFMRKSRNRGFQKNSTRLEPLKKEQTENLKSSKEELNNLLTIPWVSNVLVVKALDITRINVPPTSSCSYT